MNTLQSVVKVISDLKNISVNKINEDMFVLKDLYFDSLSFLELVAHLEAEFDVELDELVMQSEDLSIVEISQIISKEVNIVEQ
ncbi:acyl carrier protein [Bacillus toyonensis]|uniref:acyl carrier protein n=1 Tax=Bacillus cereus group TaxID=86661 RepID=UPI0018D16321|nr:acyl carrier protein [Bacillus toyonensis]